MTANYARMYLMRTLAIRRKNLAKIKERVAAGKCIIDGCDQKLVSRGLCEGHRQQWRYELNTQRDDEARVQFEENSIREGLILYPQEQRQWTKVSPFAAARVS